MALNSNDVEVADRKYDAKLPVVLILVEEDEQKRVRVAVLGDFKFNAVIQYGSIRGQKPGIVTTIVDNTPDNIRIIEQMRTSLEDHFGQKFNADQGL